MHPDGGAGVSPAHPPADEPNRDQFVYVDTAFGVDRRNKPRRLADVRLNGVADCYVSNNRATDALLTWVAEHKNYKGNPTVARFDGPTWAPNLHLDFDAEGEPEKALTWLVRVLDWLVAVGVDPQAVRIYFSGNKGFHLEIPHTLFGGFAPSTDLHRRMKRAAIRILGDIPFDGSVYDKLRLWRLPNSKNAETGRYKVRLAPAEARMLGIEAILALATAPRDEVDELAPIPDDEWMPVDELVAIWAATATEDEPERRARESRTPTDNARARQTAFAIAASWPHRGRNATEGRDDERVSRHDDYLMPLVDFLVARTSPEQAREILEDAAERAGDESSLHGRAWRAEIERLVESADARLHPDDDDDASDLPVKGLPSIAATFPVLAAVLEAAWPDPTLFARGEDGWFSAEETLAEMAKDHTNGHAPSGPAASATTDGEPDGTSRADTAQHTAHEDDDDDQEEMTFRAFRAFRARGSRRNACRAWRGDMSRRSRG